MKTIIINISAKQSEFITENCLNLTSFARRKIDQMIESEKVRLSEIADESVGETK